MSHFPDRFEPVHARRPANHGRWTWTRAQQRALAIATLLACAFFAIALWRRPTLVGDPPPALGDRFDVLKDRLDPNTASAAELAVLPGIGPSKAQAIVEYRDSQPAPAFAAPADLMRVHGIGEVTAQKLAPYLYFPEGEAASQPD